MGRLAGSVAALLIGLLVEVGPGRAGLSGNGTEAPGRPCAGALKAEGREPRPHGPAQAPVRKASALW